MTLDKNQPWLKTLSTLELQELTHLHDFVVVQRRRREAQSLSATWNGRIVDRLHVDVVVVHQHVARRFAQSGVAHHERHNVRFTPLNRQFSIGKHEFQGVGTLLRQSDVKLGY